MLLSPETSKSCLQCGKRLKGRADKKFCDDYCRNNYNNIQKAGDENLIRNIHNTLRKNRKILAMLLKADEENIKVHREKLQTAGFNFKYNTHQLQTQRGHVYIFCYNYGYLPLEKDWYLVVREKNTPAHKTEETK
ncbi:MAG: hypothetical protein QM640_11480 [Niabella sp.]